MSTTVSKRKPSPLLVIFLTVLVDMVGFGIVIPILPLYSLHFGATPWQVGMLLGSFSLMQLVFAPLLGRWSDRYGRRPVLFLSILGTALSFVILGLANSLWLLFVGRLIDGISGGNISTAQAYIADVTPLDKRSGAMGMLGAALGLGFVLGPALGGLLGHYSLQTPFYAAAALALFNAFAIYFFLPESLPQERRKHPAEPTGSIWKTLLEAKNTPFGTILLCSLLSMIGFSGVTALYTLFTENHLGWHARENGMMFAYIGFLGVIIQGGLLRRLVPKTGEKPLIILGTILLALSMFLLPVQVSFITVVVASTGISIGNSLVTPMLSGLASKSIDPKSQGMMLGLMQSTASLGRMLGPIVGGFLLNYDYHHPQHSYGITPYWAGALLMLFAVVAATRLTPSLQPAHTIQNTDEPI